MNLWRKMAVVAVALLVGQSALAGDWHKLGTFTAGGAAKDMDVRRSCDTCLIKVTEGRVTINSVVVREKADREPIKVEQPLEAGQSKEIALNTKGYIAAFRVSDSGSGKYDVYVR